MFEKVFDEKAPGSKKSYLIFVVVDILKTVLLVSSFKNLEFMDKIVWIFLLKLAKKNTFFTYPWLTISNFANIDEPVPFLLYILRMLISFEMTWV